LLAATREREGDEGTHAMVNAVATVLFWVLVVTCVLGIVGARWWSGPLAPGCRNSIWRW
jgi:putative peptidoglycan lipid II flippase